MRETNADPAVCELLLVLFSLGALLCIFLRRGLLDLELPVWGAEGEWIAVILAIDAAMAGSLLCRFLLPVTTLAFGAVSVIVGTRVLDLEENWWRWLLLLFIAAALHFLLCAWSLGTAAEIRRLITDRGHRRQLCGVSLLLMLTAASSAALVMLLFQHGLI